MCVCAQSCPTLCHPVDCSRPGYFVHGIIPARILKSEKVKVKSLSHVQLFATPWIVAYQAPPSMGFSRQEHWSELPFPSPGDLPNPGIQPGSPALQADALPGVAICSSRASSDAGTKLRSPALAGRLLPLRPLGSPTLIPHASA